MNRPDAVTVASDLVASRYPDALQAWLSGSVVLGGATATSDLDITVLLEQATVHRESLVHEGWPVELFVHTESSVRHFVAKDLERRRPTMARLVSTGIALVPGQGGADLRADCAATVAAGPGPLPAAELDLLRYSLTDQLDDLAGVAATALCDAVVIDVWRSTAELLLATAERWSGTGKWLIRELEASDEANGTSFAAQLHAALHTALAGETTSLVELADEALDRAGGRLWAGFYRGAPLPQ